MYSTYDIRYFKQMSIVTATPQITEQARSFIQLDYVQGYFVFSSLGKLWFAWK